MCVCVCVFNLIIWHIYIYIYIYLFICLFVYLFIYYYFFISISYAIICIYACIIYMIIYVWTLTIDSLKPTMLKAPRRMRARVLGSEATPGGSSQSTWETISRIHQRSSVRVIGNRLLWGKIFGKMRKNRNWKQKRKPYWFLNGKFNDRSFLGFPVFTFSRKI